MGHLRDRASNVDEIKFLKSYRVLIVCNRTFIIELVGEQFTICTRKRTIDENILIRTKFKNKDKKDGILRYFKY